MDIKKDQAPPPAQKPSAAELEAENAKLRAELAEAKKAVVASGDSETVLTLAAEKRAAGLPFELALQCAREQVKHDLALAEAAKAEAELKKAKTAKA
jgi:hypothetical protein